MADPEFQEDEDGPGPLRVVARYALGIAAVLAMMAFIPPFASWLAGVLHLIGL